MMIERADRLDGIGTYYFANKLKEIRELISSGVDVINLGIGSPDLKPHPEVMDALKQGLDIEGANKYQPYRSVLPLRQAISEWYKTKYNVTISSEDNVLPLIGSKEGVMHIAMTYLQKGDIALVPNPGYPAYATASKIAGATLVYYDLIEEHNWLPKVDELDKNAKIIWLNYPHMPTGTSASIAHLEEIVNFAIKHNILIVFDNPYSFIGNAKPLSIFSVKGAKNVAIELNSLSKSHNMAGWRMGMLIGKKEYLDDVLLFKSNMDSGMFLPIQMAAIKALSLGGEWYEKQNEIYKNRRLLIEKIVTHLGCTFKKNQVGLFVWASIPNNFTDGYKFSDFLLKNHQIFATPGGVFGSNGNQYIRFSLCINEEQMNTLFKRLKL